MSKGYHTPKEPAAYAWIEEFLCEYVDGTMDPAARLAFEEYLRGNPDLLNHVECLCEARQMLCHYGCCHAPGGFQTRFRQRLACEMMHAQRPAMQSVANRLSEYANWTSAMLIIVIVGMVAGASLMAEVPSSPALGNVDRPAVTRVSPLRSISVQRSLAGTSPARLLDISSPFLAHDSSRIALQRLDASP